MIDTPASRIPDLSEQLAAFNAERRAVLGGVPPTPDEPMLLPPTGVGGDVEEPW